jgi:hypothetical protein
VSNLWWTPFTRPKSPGSFENAWEYFEQLRLLRLCEVWAHLELGLHCLPLFLIRQARERDGVHLAYVGRVVNLALRGGGLFFQRV